MELVVYYVRSVVRLTKEETYGMLFTPGQLSCGVVGTQVFCSPPK